MGTLLFKERKGFAAGEMMHSTAQRLKAKHNRVPK